jgi:hypothetical protein
MVREASIVLDGKNSRPESARKRRSGETSGRMTAIRGGRS